ncbi:hypothetical protein N7452_006305 [Penicillium brevicompactum]|uniref:Transmembrane protein n=1 Tax=Penicillium brevicompactum TaxID=5074 RepID=A0A9W9UFZ5_PENBR|nr:hypothetical protein N7452_006305 [Penicillium brevicompactum]
MRSLAYFFRRPRVPLPPPPPGHPVTMHSWNRALPSSSASAILGRPVTAHSQAKVTPLRSCLKVRSDSVPTAFSPPSGAMKKSVRFGPSQFVEIPAREGPPRKTRKKKRRQAKKRVVHQPSPRFDARALGSSWSAMPPAVASIAMRRSLLLKSTPITPHRSPMSVFAPSKQRQVLAHSFRTGGLRASRFLSVRPPMPKPVGFAPQRVLAPSKLQSVPALPSQVSVVRSPPKTSMSEVVDAFSAGVSPILIQLLFLILVLLGFCFPGIWDILLLALVVYMAFQKETSRRPSPWCAPPVGGQGDSSRRLPRSYSALSDVRPSRAGR